MTTALPTDSEERKNVPLARGVLDYFPAALAEVARLSKIGNDKHNPGEDLHHARGKSGDHADCILRHLAERGTVDTDGLLHDVKVAWRALALLQETLEQRGAPLARAARLPDNGGVPAPRFNPGDWVEHVSARGKPGRAMFRDIHGDERGHPYPVWLVEWETNDATWGLLNPSVHWHTEDTLVRVVK